MPLHIKVMTQNGIVYENNADEVNAPGMDGDLGILPNHAPLLTTLKIGPLHLKQANKIEETLFIAGGFLEVYKDVVTILADDAERASDIDEAKAEEARKRALALLETQSGDIEAAVLQGMIERSAGRLKVAEIVRRRSHSHGTNPSA